MASTIKAVSFDLWDTLVVDDSDEAKRAAKGLRSKPAERRYLTWEKLNQVQPISLEQVSLAFDVTDAAFNKVWRELHVTWPVVYRLEVLFKGLGRAPTSDALGELIEKLETMEVEIPPDPIAGVHECLEALHGRYRLCIVSDAVVTPGRNLRKVLEQHGLARFFDAFSFSDEVGNSKPNRRAFEAAAEALSVDPGEVVHVGDRQHNDIAGAQALGIKAILFTAARDTDRPNTTADAICERHADLPKIIDGLESS